MVKDKIQLDSPGYIIYDYVRIYDDVMNPSILHKLFLYAKNRPSFCNEKQSSITNTKKGNFKNNQIRKSTSEGFAAYGVDSMTSVVLCNYLMSYFSSHAEHYMNNFLNNISDSVLINQIELIRYKETEYFKPHIDSSATAMRTLSFIFMINEDYEGGELKFLLPTNKNKEMEIKPKSNRLIIFPSNFMFPHVVKPVKKGERFTVVAWGS
tara:strand:+ start:7088 stop:7714 length:627 start_codon:yes stop_codon:yes gene_type:complete